MIGSAFLRRGAQPLVLGHRGASADYPENTVLAFREAMRAGADGVELDVMRCASGEVVVVHDDDLWRTAQHAPGSEQPVRRSTLAELRRFDVGRGEKVPTLAEVLEELGPHALLNVELKSPEIKAGRDYLKLVGDDGLAAAVAEVLARAGRLPKFGGLAETTLISSFDPIQLVRFHRRALGVVPLGFLFYREQSLAMQSLWRSSLLHLRAVHPEAALLDAVVMRRFRRAGLFVHTWTVDDPHEIAALLALGVDAIITNQPGAVRKQLGA